MRGDQGVGEHAIRRAQHVADDSEFTGDRRQHRVGRSGCAAAVAAQSIACAMPGAARTLRNNR